MNRRQFAKSALMASMGISAISGIELNCDGLEKERENELFTFKPLFNGSNLNGFVDVNTSRDTWKVEDGLLICSGDPIGVIRTEKQYENFILEIEWRHMEAGGNSGVFVWADGTPHEDNPFPRGMEVQMLDPEWSEINDRPIEYAHGHLFPVMGMEAIPDHRSEVIENRSASLENRVNGKGKWNRYIVVCVDGTLKLSVNGKFVNGIRMPARKKGYICPESEGSEIHFRTMNILELPSGVTSAEESAPMVK